VEIFNLILAIPRRLEILKARWGTAPKEGTMAPKHEPEIQSGQKGLTTLARPSWSLMDLHSEVDRLFEEFARGVGWLGRGFPDMRPFGRLETAPMMSARVNIAETNSAYEIEAELPGLEEKDIDVKVADGVLTLSGERREEKEEKNKNYHVMERSHGSLRRSFAIPDNVVEDDIEAKYANGVLTVTMPKREPGKAKPGEKKIAIKAGRAS
jgi:HSP20 family protein